jgi:hypothetical protein
VFVLAIACSNVINLMLRARSTGVVKSRSFDVGEYCGRRRGCSPSKRGARRGRRHRRRRAGFARVIAVRKVFFSSIAWPGPLFSSVCWAALLLTCVVGLIVALTPALETRRVALAPRFAARGMGNATKPVA